MSEVQYKIVVGFPGYRVGTDGTIWSRLVRGRVGKGVSQIGKEWRKLRQATDRDGYKFVKLCWAGENVVIRVHRLVLEAFAGPPLSGQETRHLDGNPGHNQLSNLRWGTSSENSRDAVAHGTHNTRGQKNGNAKLSELQAREIRKRARIGECPQDLADEFRVSPVTVCDIKLGRRWPCLDDDSSPGVATHELDPS